MSFDNLPKTDPIALPAPPEVVKPPRSVWTGRPKAAADLRTTPPPRVGAPRLAELRPEALAPGECTSAGSSSMTVA